MDIQFNKNEDHNKLLVSDLKRRLKEIKLGGGEKRINKQHAKGKMTARERIDYLLDDKESAVEIGAFAGDGMYEEHGGCPSGGVVVKIGKVSGKQCIVVANDATVKAGAWFPITARRTLGRRRSPLRIDFPLSILWILQAFIFLCRMRYFRIKNTSGGYLGIMR